MATFLHTEQICHGYLLQMGKVNIYALLKKQLKLCFAGHFKLVIAGFYTRV